MKTPKILVIDDEGDQRELIIAPLQRRLNGIESEITHANFNEALGRIESAVAAGQEFDVIFLDLADATGLPGLALAEKVRLNGWDQVLRRTVVISGFVQPSGQMDKELLGARAVPKAATEVLDLCFDVLRKPVSPDLIVRHAEFLCSLSHEPPIRAELDAQAKRLSRRKTLDERGEPRSDECFENLIGRSRVLRIALENALLVARTKRSVLLLGESGTGKGEMAQAIHDLSGVDGPFVPVNCAAIPSDLLEAELFGNDMGAFTGATVARPGIIKKAAGGTLFLDEIGDMPLLMQVKLLRFLDDRKVQRLGSTKVETVDVRVIAATDRADLPNGEFDDALYYRLAEAVIKMPTLRQQFEGEPMDIARLIRHVAGKAGMTQVTRADAPVTLGALKQLAEYSWPGNHRTFRQIITGIFDVMDADKDTQVSAVDVSAALATAPARRTTASARQGVRSGVTVNALFTEARELLREHGVPTTGSDGTDGEGAKRGVLGDALICFVEYLLLREMIDFAGGHQQADELFFNKDGAKDTKVVTNRLSRRRGELAPLNLEAAREELGERLGDLELV